MGWHGLSRSCTLKQKKQHGRGFFYYQSFNHEFLEWPIYKYLKHYRSTINRSAECQDMIPWTGTSWVECGRSPETVDSANVTSDACRQFHTARVCNQKCSAVNSGAVNRRWNDAVAGVRATWVYTQVALTAATAALRHSHALKSTELVSGCL